ncbi:MAG: dethiobiotin synthase [Candidatus Sabulitectum sp.]|nr:dethiobiotin synthase [Candidatus Sabulitectum sp.]
MRSLFITGTDTDVGKTVVTAGIVSGFVNSGVNATPAKPVQTGCVNGIAEDLEFSLRTAGLSFSEQVLNKLSPLRFTPACSPHLAAELADRLISLSEMVSGLHDLQSDFECVVAEGAGGVLVPLGNGKTMLDLMVKLNWPVVLVSSDRLGTINHTLLSISVLRHAGLCVAGVVIDHVFPPWELISESNARAIREYGKVNILGDIPYSPDSFPHDPFVEICGELKGILSDELPGD